MPLYKLVLPFLLTGVLLAACSTPGVPPASSVPPTPTNGGGTPSPTGNLVTPPVGALATPRGTLQAPGGMNAAGISDAVRQTLAQQLSVKPEAIQVASVEQVEWPDACIGVQIKGVMCAMVVTPGYRVVLEANQQRYEYHTNLNGSLIRLASGPQSSQEDVAVAWHREGGFAGFCDDLAVYANGTVSATSCKGGTTDELGRLSLKPAQLDQLNTWLAAYKSFEIDQQDAATADAMTVHLVFNGTGQATADPATQQAILRLASEVYAGLSSTNAQ